MDFSLTHIADAVHQVYTAFGAHLPPGMPAYTVPAVFAGCYFLLILLCGMLAKWRGQSFYWGFFLSLFATPIVALCFIPFINPSKSRSGFRPTATRARRRSAAKPKPQPRAVTRTRRRRAAVKR